MPALLIVVVVAAALGLVVWLVMRSRSADTSVDSFRRQIDALGPEARRNVVDQVNNAAEGNSTAEGTSTAEGSSTPDETPGEGGARGS